MKLNKQNRQSQISILILWAMIFFIFIIISFGKRTSYEAKMVLSTKERTQALFLIWDAIKHLEKILTEDDITVDSLKDKWAKIPIEGKTKEGKWKVEILYDEESLININKMSKDQIGKKVLKRIFGVYPEYYLCLLDWLDKDNLVSQDPDYPGYTGAEKDNPFYIERGYSPRNSDMRSLFEIFLVKEGDNLLPSSTAQLEKENFYPLIKIAYACGHPAPPTQPPGPPEPPPAPPPGPAPELPPIPVRDPSPTGTGITLYGDGRVNINTAWDPVLRALGFNKETVARLLAYRFKGNIFNTTDSTYIINRLVETDCLRQNEASYEKITRNIKKVISEGKLKTNSEYFRVKVETETNNGARYKAIMVLKRKIKSAPPPKLCLEIVSWWENYL